MIRVQCFVLGWCVTDTLHSSFKRFDYLYYREMESYIVLASCVWVNRVLE